MGYSHQPLVVGFFDNPLLQLDRRDRRLHPQSSRVFMKELDVVYIFHPLVDEGPDVVLGL